MLDFLTALIADKTSSDKSKLLACDLHFAIDENKTHLMLRLLSPETYILLLKLLILFLKVIKNCEMARYSPINQVKMEEDYNSAIDLIEFIDKEHSYESLDNFDLDVIDYEEFLDRGDSNYQWLMPENEWDAISVGYTCLLYTSPSPRDRG